MSHRTSIQAPPMLFDLGQLTRSSMGGVERALARFPRALSICYLQVSGVPVPNGAFVTGPWSPSTADALEQFLQERQWPRVLLRSFTPFGRVRKPRGGYLVSAAQIPALARDILQDGRLAVLHEPVNRLENRFSGNFRLRDGRVNFEIMGGGFDLANLSRGDFDPHESFYVWWGPRLIYSKRVFNVHIIDSLTYKAAVARRADEVIQIAQIQGDDLKKTWKVNREKHVPVPLPLRHSIIDWAYLTACVFTRHGNVEVVGGFIIDRDNRLLMLDVQIAR